MKLFDIDAMDEEPRQGPHKFIHVEVTINASLEQI